jgi:hypothetical protein
MLHGNSGARVMLDRMMECSEEQISEVARYGERHQKLVACRVLESAHNFRHWEGTHSQLLRQIVNAGTAARQILQVRRMALSMIHRKAPFEYLRDKHVCGAARHRFFHVMYGPHDFASAVVHEHRNYLAAGASYLCVERFCAESSMRSLADYERRYTGYWRAHTARLLNERTTSSKALPERLLEQVRRDLQQRRNRVLNAVPSKADELTMEELRRPTGDTVRLIYSPPRNTQF